MAALISVIGLRSVSSKVSLAGEGQSWRCNRGRRLGCSRWAATMLTLTHWVGSSQGRSAMTLSSSCSVMGRISPCSSA
ncbi:hypothetical protein D3C78_1104100 [compost metagenome]